MFEGIDFKGATAAEAAEALIRFILESASEQSPTVTHHGGIAKKACTIVLAHFHAEIVVDAQSLSFVKQKGGIHGHFGSGYVTTPRVAMLLELRRDDEGWYRWYRVPATVGFLNRLVPAQDARWFPLVSSVLTELLSENAA